MNARLSRALPVILVAAFCIGAGHPHPMVGRPEATAKAAASVRLSTAQAQQTRQQRILTLTRAIPSRLQDAANQGNTASATPRPLERLRGSQNVTPGQDNIIDRNDAIANQIPSEMLAPPPGVLAVGPVSDAVAHICGPNVTVCGIWWPTAVTDRAQYQNCVHQTSSNDLDFGASPVEYCSALYTGDCEGAAPGSDIYELCSLVPGVAAQWTPQYGFSKFITHGDCGYYKTVDVREHNVFGFQLQQPDRPERPASPSASKPALKICTGRLYLKILQ